jgi:hypothetical protein
LRITCDDDCCKIPLIVEPVKDVRYPTPADVKVSVAVSNNASEKSLSFEYTAIAFVISDMLPPIAAPNLAPSIPAL